MRRLTVMRPEELADGLRGCSPAIAMSGAERIMNGIIYIIGLIVVVLAILSFLGLR